MVAIAIALPRLGISASTLHTTPRYPFICRRSIHHILSMLGLTLYLLMPSPTRFIIFVSALSPSRARKTGSGDVASTLYEFYRFPAPNWGCYRTTRKQNDYDLWVFRKLPCRSEISFMQWVGESLWQSFSQHGWAAIGMHAEFITTPATLLLLIYHSHSTSEALLRHLAWLVVVYFYSRHVIPHALLRVVIHKTCRWTPFSKMPLLDKYLRI